MRLEDALRQARFDSPSHRAVINLLYTASWLEASLNTYLARFALSSQQYRVLRILKASYPDAISAGELKAILLDKNPDLTRLVDRLLTRGLLQRELNPANRRQILLQISAKGLELLATTDAPDGLASATLNQLSDRESDSLSDLLDKLRG